MSSDASVGDGGVAGEPRLKKRRTEFQHDGPVEDEETARKKMEEAGFDPNDVTKECRLSEDARKASNTHYNLRMHPMTYFCGIGDLKMCRYLLSKGASTTAANTDGFWFPTYAAALRDQLDVCKWLYAHGAKEDVGRRNSSDYSPLGCATSQACCRWFILKGVLSLDDKPGVVDPERMRQRRGLQTRTRDSVYRIDVRPQLLEWAQQSVQTHSGFMTFFMGTLPAPAFTQAALQSLLAECLQSQDAAEMVMSNFPAHQYECLWGKLITKRTTTPVRCLGGEKIGILELIADYVGVVRGRDLRILRSLVDPLSKYLEEVPEGRVEHEDEE